MQIVTGPARGSITLDGAAVADGQWITAADIAAGRLRFAAGADENGADSPALEFGVRDDGGRFEGGVDTEAGSHTLATDVSPVNDAPVVGGEGYTLDEDTPLVVTGAGVLANDSDIDGDPLLAPLVRGPAHGSLTLAAEGSFIYTPDANWSGAEVQVGGKSYSVYIGKRVSLAHQSQIHGRARIGDDTFVGMRALVFRTELGDRVVVEPGAKLIGVKVASGRYVPALTLVTTQEQADALPLITPAYPSRNLNEGVVTVNVQLAKAGQPKQISLQSDLP